MKRRNAFDDVKTRAHHYSGISMADTYLLAMRRPAYSRHDLYPGFRTELENRVDDGKGKGTSETTRG